VIVSTFPTINSTDVFDRLSDRTEVLATLVGAVGELFEPLQPAIASNATIVTPPPKKNERRIIRHLIG
jgi:hypothetical protein